MPESAPDDPTLDTRLAETIRRDSGPAPAGAPRPEEPAGTTFGRYRLLEELGRGGMGVVWRAWDTKLQRVVALKQVLGRAEEDRAAIERFLREARLAAKLSHPAIVQVHDVGEEEGRHYFTCDYVAGRPLSAALEAPIAPAKAAAWVRQIAEALAYAHDQGVIHRDVKPANVLLDADGRPHVMDFGLAREVNADTSSGLTMSGDLLGTPTYMSPEQASGRQERIGPATDQFSLGVVLYQLLTNGLPFQGETLRDVLNAVAERDPAPPSRVRANLHPDLEAICLHALEKDPVRRYPSMRAFAEDLGRYLDGEAVVARRITGLARLLRNAARNRRLLLPVGALAVAAAVAVGWIVRDRARLAADASAGIERARSAELRGALETARDEYMAVRAILPSHEDAALGLARVEARIADLAAEASQAERDAMQLLEAGRPALDDARRYLYAKDLDYQELTRRVAAGQALIDRALEKAPHLPLAHHLAGRAWRLLGWNEKAEASWLEAIRLDPRFGLAHFELGMLLLDLAIETRAMRVTLRGVTSERSRVDRATALLARSREELDAATSLSWTGDDEVSRALAEAAQAYVVRDRGRIDKLTRTASTTLRGGIGIERFFLLRALAGDPADRRADLDRALEIGPHDALALVTRGIDRMEEGDVDGAIADYSAALVVYPRSRGALVDRGCAYLESNRPEEALADLDRLVELDPTWAPAWLNRGLAKHVKEDLDGAIADFEKALAIEPGLASAIAQRGESRLLKGDAEGALGDFDRAIQADPKCKEAWFYRGKLRLERGDLPRALADFEKSLAIDPTDALCLVGRGTVRLRQGNVDAAIADYDAAVASKPACEDALYNRAIARKVRGDMDGAIADCDRALAIAPKRTEIRMVRASALSQKGDQDGAIEEFTRALSIDAKLHLAFAGRAIAKSDKGDAAGAAADLKEALRLAPSDWPLRAGLQEMLDDLLRAERR